MAEYDANHGLPETPVTDKDGKAHLETPVTDSEGKPTFETKEKEKADDDE